MNRFARALGKKADAPDPDFTPVLEEEEQAEERNYRAGGQGNCRRSGVEGTKDQGLGMGLNPSDNLGLEVLKVGIDG